VLHRLSSWRTSNPATDVLSGETAANVVVSCRNLEMIDATVGPIVTSAASDVFSSPSERSLSTTVQLKQNTVFKVSGTVQRASAIQLLFRSACNRSLLLLVRRSLSTERIHVSTLGTGLSPRPSVGLYVRTVYCGKTADWIQMAFGVVSVQRSYVHSVVYGCFFF